MFNRVLWVSEYSSLWSLVFLTFWSVSKLTYVADSTHTFLLELNFLLSATFIAPGVP